MGIKRVAAMLTVLSGLLGAQPAQAEWKDALVRSVAPTLVNRAINYLTRQRPQTRPWAPVAQDKPVAPARSPSAPAKKQTTNAPAAPVVTPQELGLIDTSQSTHTASTRTFEIPPPPKVLVPPPPPGIPTGAILGLYPDELMPYRPAAKTSNLHSPAEAAETEASMPKVAPDFRRLQKTNNR